jgi:hypothetical protein
MVEVVSNRAKHPSHSAASTSSNAALNSGGVSPVSGWTPGARLEVDQHEEFASVLAGVDVA